MLFDYTPQERAQLEALTKQIKTITYEMVEEINALPLTASDIEKIQTGKGDEVPAYIEIKERYYAQLFKISDQLAATLRDLEAARFAKLGSPAAILEDAKNRAQNAITYSYAVHLNLDQWKRQRDAVGITDQEPTTPEENDEDFYNALLPVEMFPAEIVAKFKAGEIAPGPEDAGLKLDSLRLIRYIKDSVIDEHIKALKGTPEAVELESYLATAMAASPYVTTVEATPTEGYGSLNKEYLPIYSGPAVNIVLRAGNKNKNISYNGRVTYNVPMKTNEEPYRLEIIPNQDQEISDLVNGLASNERMLFLAAVTSMAQSHSPTVVFGLDDYSDLRGYKKTPRALKATRKRVRTSLSKLQGMHLTISGHDNIDLFSAVYFDTVFLDRSGNICIKFGDTMAKYLMQCKSLTMLPRGFFTIDPNNDTAASIALKMIEHYNMDSNRDKPGRNRLSVKTLLSAAADLPTIETLRNEKRNNQRQWEARIKDPLENALIEITGKVITSWQYNRPGGTPLTDEEAYNVPDYETFSNLIVQFEMEEAPGQAERAERRAVRIRQATQKAEQEQRRRKRSLTTKKKEQQSGR